MRAEENVETTIFGFLFFRYLALVLIIVALARPQTAFKRNKIDVEGVDIVITLDISGSMKMMDFLPTVWKPLKKLPAILLKEDLTIE